MTMKGDHSVTDSPEEQPGVDGYYPAFVNVCTLKWFNQSKGFGFVVPDDHPGRDAFIHVSVLQDVGIRELGEDARLECKLARTERGFQVICVEKLVDCGRLDSKLTKIPLAPDAMETYTMSGFVKWFSAEKGYGFIAADDGMKDIFIHQSCLQRNGIDPEQFIKGNRVRMQIRDVDQGREVVGISLAESENSIA